MKKLFNIVLISFLLVIYACRTNNPTASPSLSGKWKLTETLNDPGDGSGKFIPVPEKANYEYVEFKANGVLSGTVFAQYIRYTVKDSATVSFFKSDNTLQNYRYTFHDNVLDMSPAGPIFCFEPCAQRFIKVVN